MSKYFKIIIDNLKADWPRNIIMIAFVGISVFLMNISLSRFMHREYINSLVRDCGLYYDYMYSTPPDKKVYYENDNSQDKFNLRDAAIKYIHQQLDILKAEGKVEAFYGYDYFNAPISDDINDRATYIIYPKRLVSDLKFPISSGKWLSAYSFDDEYIPVVIGSDLSSRYKIGDTITLPTQEKKALIIGVLERNAMILKLGATGNGVDLNDAFSLGNNAVIACVNSAETENSIGGTIIKAAPQYHQDIFDRISDVSYTFTFKELSERAFESNSLLTEMQTVVFALMMIVCVSGVSSGNLIETINCKKRYAVYFMCGMDWVSCTKITVLESSIKLIFPSVFGYWGFLRWCSKESFYALRITNFNIIVTAALILAVFLLTSLKPLFDIRRTSPVKIISET